MKEQREFNKILQSLCKSARDGVLTLKDFHRQWPEEANTNLFFKQLYEDIEDGVEHIPGFIFKRGVDYKSWHNSESYLILYLDFILLGFDKSADELQQCRSFVLEQEKLSEEIIKDRVKEYFSE
ncbi:MAG: hypothetical protein HY755_00245 [Nitrospirae bacterium]|nr:hypothetical protein [Nitrospirota bacterium]